MKNASPSVLLELEALEQLDGALEAGDFALEVSELLTVLLLQGLAGLLLVLGVVKELLLFLDGRLGLLQLLVGLFDLAVDVDAALDVQEDSDGAGDGVDDATGGPGIGAGQDLDAGDALSTQRLDGLHLVDGRLVSGLIKGLDKDCTNRQHHKICNSQRNTTYPWPHP